MIQIRLNLILDIINLTVKYICIFVFAFRIILKYNPLCIFNNAFDNIKFQRYN